MSLTKKETAALAMHELMKREQSLSRKRVQEQLEISNLSDEELKKMVNEL